MDRRNEFGERTSPARDFFVHCNTVKPTSCLICGAQAATIVQSYDTPDVYERAVGVDERDYNRAWVRCEKCRFTYSRYSRDPDALDRIYSQSYRDDESVWRKSSIEQTFQKITSMPIEQSETKIRVAWIKSVIADAMRANLIEWPTPPWRMVDVGGANGIFAFEFLDEDWRSTVIDPASQGRFLENYGIDYIQGEYRPGLLKKKANLGAMIYALEHLRDPEQAIAGIVRDLEYDGLVYIEVPDAMAFGRKPETDDIFNACHLWMFDPASLMALLDRNGFEVLSLKRTLTIRGHYCLMMLAKVKQYD